MARYETSLVRRTPSASSGVALTEVGALAASGLSWSDELSRDGQATAVVKMQTMTDAVVEALVDQVPEALDTGQVPGFEIWIRRDGTLVWAGPIVHLRLRPNQISFTARGLMYYLRRMWVKYSDLTFSGADQYAIAAGLVDHWQDEDWNDYGIDTSGVGTSGTTRDRTYLASENHNVYDRTIELAEVADGFDITIDPESRDLVLASPKGTDKTASVVLDRRNLVAPQLEVVLSAEALASEAFGTSEGLASTQVNTTLRESFGGSGVAASWQGVTVQGTLDDHTEALRDARAVPLVIPTLEARPVNEDGVESFDVTDFESGDTIAIDYTFGRSRTGDTELAVTATRRVLSRTVKVDDLGGEKVSVMFA